MSSTAAMKQGPHYQEADELAQILLSDPPSDPYPLYNRLREIAPIHQLSTTGDWVVSSYDLCNEALRDPRFLRDFDNLMTRQHGGQVDYSRPIIEHRARQFSHLNPPEYMKMRTAFMKSVTPSAVSKLDDEIEGYANALLDAAVERGGELEVATEYSMALTLMLICRILGFPSPEGGAADWLGSFQAYGNTFRSFITEQMLDEADEAINKLNEMIRGQVEYARQHPSDTLIGQLLRMEIDGEPLPEDVLVANAIFMFTGAVGTSSDLISNAVLALMRNRDQWDLLTQDPEGRAKGAVEEALRFDNAVLSNPPSRLAFEDIEIGQYTIAKGESVIPLYGAGNHDPARFDDPEKFDITREDNRPLSFGGGPHVCPGQHLARAQTRIALTLLAKRFPGMTLIDEDPRRTIMPLQRGIASMRVRLTA